MITLVRLYVYVNKSDKHTWKLDTTAVPAIGDGFNIYTGDDGARPDRHIGPFRVVDRWFAYFPDEGTHGPVVSIRVVSEGQ